MSWAGWPGRSAGNGSGSGVRKDVVRRPSVAAATRDSASLAPPLRGGAPCPLGLRHALLTPTPRRRRSAAYVLPLLVAACGALSQVAAGAEEWPSVFRGMTVEEGEPGVTVVFLTEDAFAGAAGLHAGDHIVAIEERAINTLDDFAEASLAIAGKRTEANVTILRGGERFTTALTLTSVPVRSAWGMVFLPDYSLRFADPKAAHHYWSQRAAKELVAGSDFQAMKSLLNVLHYAPDSYDEALALCEAVQRQGERLWARGQRAEAIGVLQQAVALYRQAATKPLTLPQWARIKRNLRHLSETLAQPSLNHAATTSPAGS